MSSNNWKCSNSERSIFKANKPGTKLSLFHLYAKLTLSLSATHWVKKLFHQITREQVSISVSLWGRKQTQPRVTKEKQKGGGRARFPKIPWESGRGLSRRKYTNKQTKWRRKTTNSVSFQTFFPNKPTETHTPISAWGKNLERVFWASFPPSTTSSASLFFPLSLSHGSSSCIWLQHGSYLQQRMTHRLTRAALTFLYLGEPSVPKHLISSVDIFPGVFDV